jgi:hypothetical protein
MLPNFLKAFVPLQLIMLSLHAAGPMTDYYVTPGGAAGVSCQSSEPCSFQTALDYADNDTLDNTIHVAAGTYSLSGTSLAFSIMEDKSLTIEGANAATTIIDGAHSTRLMKITRSVTDPNVHITIKNLTFTRGGTFVDGKGLWVSNLDQGSITLEGNRFILNAHNDGDGGGLYIENLNGTTILKRNIFRDNHGDAGGGAYIDSDYGTIQVIDNEFTNNSVSSMIEHNGGGLYTDTYTGIVVVANNIFTKNSAINNGGGYYCRIQSSGVAYIVNNTITDNSADAYGGGIYVKMFVDASQANIYNNIIWGNSAIYHGEDIYINNDGISTGATCNFSYNVYGADPIDYTAHITGKVNASYNIQKNPLLTGFSTLSDGRRSLRLFTGSPAINKGNSCVTGIQSTDYEGAPRVQDTYVNLGAVEAIVPIMAPVYYLLMQ